MKTIRPTKAPITCCAAAAITVLTTAANAAPGTLADEPLITQNGTSPNIIFIKDNSGSMDWELLLSGANEGMLWWKDSTQSFVSGGALTSGDPDVHRRYAYLFPNGYNGGSSNEGRRAYEDGDRKMYAVPPIIQYAYTRSPDYNRAYFDPAPEVEYEPWASYGSVTFTNVDPDDAPAEPTETDIGDSFFDLTADIEWTGSNEIFRMFPGMVLPAGARHYNGSSWTDQATDLALTSQTDYAISYYPATYYLKVDSGSYTVGSGGSYAAGDCASPDPNHYLTFEDQPSSLSDTGSGNVVALAYDGGCLSEHKILDPNSAMMQKFANWFTYYRKRHLALRGGALNAFIDFDKFRVDSFVLHNLDTVVMKDLGVASERETFFNELLQPNYTTSGTPNRQALQHAGKQYMETASIIQNSCQQNYTIQFTDGYSEDSDLSDISNEDGGAIAPFGDGHSDTLADVAYHYFNANLRPDIAATGTGNVPVDVACSLGTADPWIDCQSDLHMVTHTVGLGASGQFVGQTVAGVDYNTVQDAHANPFSWPEPMGKNATQIDDLYHAAINGRGDFHNANSPADLRERIADALRAIGSGSGSAAAVTFNTSEISSDSRLFLNTFTAGEWSGDVQAFTLNQTTGAIDSTGGWSAADLLNARSPASRFIVSFNNDSGVLDGVPFQWANLSTAQQDDLRAEAPGGIADLDAFAQARLNFLRGDTTNPTYDFRGRESALGDIVHSGAVFVGNEPAVWRNGFTPGGSPAYSDFINAMGDRPEIVYVGANDGMLHGFLAADSATPTFGAAPLVPGDEVLAYIPGNLFSTNDKAGLHYLTERDYQHKFYVDLTPSVSDAYVKGTDAGTGNGARKWRTVLVGGERAGGRGIFALDVTDPSLYLNTSNAADIVLWEFSSADDPDLGHTFSRPVVVPVAVGPNPDTNAADVRWFAIFGNGYEDTDGNDGSGNPINGGDGKSKLFILDLEGGLDGQWTLNSDYFKLSTESGAVNDRNGLASPAVIDSDGDGYFDRVYAGDLKGQMWVFDLSDTTETNWGSAFLTGATPAPLFTTAANQPITVEPTLTAPDDYDAANPSFLVLFGSGQYIVDADSTSDGGQAYYGVIDDQTTGNLQPTDLLQQSLSVNLDGTRAVSTNSYDTVNPEHGWYLNLAASAGTPAERVNTRGLLRGDALLFNTLLPTADTCSFGGSGWRMAVDVGTGGLATLRPFDTNGDGDVDNVDNHIAGEQYTATLGQPSESSILGNQQYTSGSRTVGSGNSGSGGDGGIDKKTLWDIESVLEGRLSWRELFDN